MKSGALFETAGISGENDEWYTPSWLFKALALEFDLDPCSPGSPPSSVPAKRHLTKVENGLQVPWEGRVWLNPPFSSSSNMGTRSPNLGSDFVMAAWRF